MAIAATENTERRVNIDLQVEPDPIGTSAVLAFYVPQRSEVIITVYNEFGRQVEEVVHGIFPGGTHTVTWNVVDIPAGTYYCQLQLGPDSLIRKICLTGGG